MITPENYIVILGLSVLLIIIGAIAVSVILGQRKKRYYESQRGRRR